MNPTTPDSPEVIARRRKEVSGLLRIAREQGYRILPDPDRRGICIGFTVPGRTHLSGTALELLRREREAYDHLEALSRLAVAVLEDDTTEGVPGTASDLQGPALPGADRAPSIPRRYPDRVIPPPEPWPNPVPPGISVETGTHPVCHGGRPDCNGNTCTLPKGHAGGHSPFGRFHPCPACDPGRPCLDHGGVPEQVPPPMPRWLVVTIGAVLFGVVALVVKVLLFPAVPR